MKTTTRTGLELAVEILGSASALATYLGVSPQAISFWRTGARKIPADVCPSIEEKTVGRVTCEELLPEHKWVRIHDTAWPHPVGRPLLDFSRTASAEPASAGA